VTAIDVAQDVSEREFEILGYLLSAKYIRPDWDGWLTPMYCGGRDASYHSATLRMTRKGLVLKKRRAGHCRRSYLYKIGEAGKMALAKYRTEEGKSDE